MEKLLKPSLVISYFIGAPWILYRSHLNGELNAAAILPGALWIAAMMIMMFGSMMWYLATGVTGQDESPSLGRFIFSLIIAIALAFFFGGGDPNCIVNVRAGQC
jgi:hypothetical protein